MFFYNNQRAKVLLFLTYANYFLNKNLKASATRAISTT
jgi:hypothetical protein